MENLEYNEIINQLCNYCDTDIGKNLAKTLKPLNNKEQIKELLSQTEEAVNLIYKASSPVFYNFEDIKKYIKILKANGTLSIKALLELTKILQLADNLKKYFNEDYISNKDFPILAIYFEQLYTNPSIIKKVNKIILDEITIDDKASNNLYNIRQKKYKIEGQIKEKLNSFLHKPSYSKYIQEHIVTIRNDRFVIPVKEEYRSQIHGFIHDISNAGSTIFIEPTIIFELNNELNNLKYEEEIEIEQILTNLSALFTPYIEELSKDTNIIGKLDFIFAKAKYSNAIKGITPKINTKKEITLINARHPLIAKEKVVPISITLGKDFNSCVITRSKYWWQNCMFKNNWAS